MRLRAVLAFAGLAALAACESERSYYADRCESRGYARDNAAHERCVSEERDWIERTNREFREYPRD